MGIRSEPILTSTTPVLFLDIDGVLIAYPEGDYAVDGFTPACVRAFKDLLAACPKLRVVLSTTWRLQRSFLRLHAQWLKHGLDPALCVSATPDLGSRPGGLWSDHLRGREIRAWLEEHPLVERWVVLDDDWGGIDPVLDPSRCVFTDPRVGLTLSDVERAREILEDSRTP